MNKIYPLTNEYEKIEYDHGPGGTTEYKNIFITIISSSYYLISYALQKA